MRRPRSVPALLVVGLVLALLLSACGKDKAKEPTAGQLVQAGLAAAAQGNDQAAFSAFQQAAAKDPKSSMAAVAAAPGA